MWHTTVYERLKSSDVGKDMGKPEMTNIADRIERRVLLQTAQAVMLILRHSTSTLSL